MGIKLDMAKTYVMLEWYFICNTLLALGFPTRIFNAIMNCITIFNFSILINVNPTNKFSQSRGIRQGDPSPFAFLSYVIM